MRVRLFVGILAPCVLLCGSAWAQQSGSQTQASQTQSLPPATGQAVDDKAASNAAKHATSADRDNAQKIHQSLTDDKSLSSSARNVKINSRDGKVILHGTVQSEDEKKTVEQKAAEVAGAGNVTAQLTIKAPKHQQ